MDKLIIKEIKKRGKTVIEVYTKDEIELMEKNREKLIDLKTSVVVGVLVGVLISMLIVNLKEILLCI